MPDFELVTQRIEEDLAFIEIDCPGARVNTMTSKMIDELSELLEALSSRNEVRGAVVLSKKDDFMVGFDIGELGELAEHPEHMKAVARKGHTTMSRLAALDIPVVAAIRGKCLGAGLEIALACSARVASEDAMLGLPEVQLGLFPGGGGTQRLPRLVDLQLALDMILTGKTLDAARAQSAGLVDDVVHRGILVEIAAELARQLVRQKPKRAGNGFLGDLMHDPMKAVTHTPARVLVFNRAREAVQARTGGHYPAPLAAIDCIEIGLRDGIEAGIAAEIELFAEMLETDVSKNLRNVFLMKHDVNCDPMVDPGITPPPIEKVGVLGAGLMGAGIAQVLAVEGVDVRLKDRDHHGLSWGLTYARGLFDKAVKAHKLTDAQRDIAFGRIAPTTDFRGFASCDLVIEAVFEDLEIKTRMLAEIEALGNEDLIFASNTSTIPISEIAANAERPHNVLGMHFFSPVHKMPLLEIIRTQKTSDRALATALAVGRQMGKTCVIVRDGPGFFTSRVVGAYVNEAAWLLQEGGAIDAIDRAMEDWGFPVGPIKLVDEVGIDVTLKASKTLNAAFSERWSSPSTLATIFDDGRKGRKNGRGFYRYVNGEARGPDPSIYEIIGQAAKRKQFSHAVIQDRCWFAMLAECARCLQEEVVSSPRDVDIGAIFGLGFPPFRGGILHHADQLGLDEVVRRMNALASEYGDRLAPPSSLRRMAEDRKTFFDERG